MFGHFSAPKLAHISDKSQAIGSYFSVYCTIEEGSLPVFFEWFKNLKSLSLVPGVNYKIENSKISSTLTIENVNINDEGNYTCTSKNGFGSDSQNVVLNLKGTFFQFFFLTLEL